jgi:hypothetical protein
MSNCFLLLCTLSILFSHRAVQAQSHWNFMEPDEKIFFDTTVKYSLSLPEVYKSKDFKIRYGKKSNKLKINYSQNLDALSLQELRLLKFTLLAKNGYIFQDAYLRDYFCGESWFQPIYWDKPFTLPIDKKDLAFYSAIKIKEEALLKSRSKDTTFHLKDLCNKDIFNVDTTEIHILEKNGFIITPPSKENFWSLYEENRYQKVPSFVTTDAFLHVVNLYYQFVMNSIETESLLPALDSLCYTIYTIAGKDSKESADSTTREQAKFAQFYYGVACKLLNRKEITFDKKYSQAAETYYTSAMEATTLDEKDTVFDDKIPFNLFKPRGNYNSSEAKRRYFRAVSWLGLVPFKLKNDEQFGRVQYLTSLITKHKEIEELYTTYASAVTFLVGKSDNPSLFDIAKLTYTDRAGLLREIAKGSGNRINEVGRLADTDIELYTLPKSYTPDAEAITKVINIVEDSTRREFPRGLDILAGKGIQSAENLLLEYYHEQDTWPEYKDNLQRTKTIFEDNDKRSDNAYSFWLRMIATLFARDAHYPLLMRKPTWDYKSLNAGLASYAQLKHNTVLYAEQPSATEGDDGGDEYEMPEPSLQVGYVEPNLAFWESAQKFIGKLDQISTKEDKSLIKRIDFYVGISKKELNGEEITANEFADINDIGIALEGIENSLKSVNEDLTKPAEDSTENPTQFENDNSLQTVADIYTLNSTCLELGVGEVREIYTIVPINGYSYLCRGGVFSYYEFTHDANNRLTDEEWQIMIGGKKLPELQPWLQPFTSKNFIGNSELYERPRSFIEIK